jgi:PKD repeat protein
MCVALVMRWKKPLIHKIKSNANKKKFILLIEILSIFLANISVFYSEGASAVNITEHEFFSTLYVTVDPPGNITNEYPLHQSTNIDLQPTCNVDVIDPEGDNLTVYWYEFSTGLWILRQTDYNITANSTVYWFFSQANSYSTQYHWRVRMYDGTYNTTKDFWFITKAESPGTPSSPPPPDVEPPLNIPPVANITGPISGYVNETLIFHAHNSYDPDGNITGYKWDFNNDGSFDTDWLEDEIIDCNYSIPGKYTIVLEVKDDFDAIGATMHNITIIDLEAPLKLPLPKINGPYSAEIYENITFSSNGSCDPDGIIVNYTWYFGDGNVSYLENPIYAYQEPGNYTVVLKVTDNDNLSNITTTKSYIQDIEIIQPLDQPEIELPLTFLVLISMALISMILVTYFIFGKFNLTFSFEKIDSTTKFKKKIKKKEKKDDLDSKVDKILENSKKK